MYIMDDVLDLMDSLGETLEKGKRGAKRVLRGEGGFSTLVTVLVILALGAIIITPLLVFVVTGQRAGRTHNEVTDRLYAADTGIQDGMWRVQNDDLPSWMLGTWGGDVYDQSYTYMLPTQVNDKDVSVTLRGVWLLEGLESMKNGREPHAELVTVGNVMSAGQYKIVIMDNGITGTYWLERIGVWLPAGFTYVEGSSNLENLDMSDPAYLVPTISEFKGGHTVIWDYDASPKKKVEYDDLPAETPTRRVITFNYTPGGPMANAFSWCRTNRNDIYLSWSGDLKQFQIEATATDPSTGFSTTVIAANMKNEGLASGMAVNGDYVVTGQALIRDQDTSGHADGYYRERLYKETPATLSGVPDSGTARKILLYWNGWKSFPFDVWYEENPDVSTWSDAHRQTLLNLVPNYKLDKVSLTVDLGGAGTYYFPLVQADSWQVVPNAQNGLSQDPWDYPNGWTYSCYVDVTNLVKDYLLGVLTEEEYADFNGEAVYTVGHAEGSEALALEEILQGIWGNSASDVYVVGDSGTIVRFDGAQWTTIAVGTTQQDLKDVWCYPTGDVWAVGDSYSVGGNAYYTILHSSDNGTTWVDGDGGIVNGASLKGLWGSSDSNIFAVGASGRIMRYNGSAWSVQTTPRTETLRGVWGSSATDVWAVGDTFSSSHTDYYTLLHTTNGGTNWTNYSMTGSQNLYGVWGTSASAVYAVGAGGTILYYNGTSWSSPFTTKPSGSAYVTLYGVWGTGGTDWAGGDRVYAVGYNNHDHEGVIWYYDGGSEWHNMNCGSSRALYGAWGSAQDNIYAVGEATNTAGTLLQYDGVDSNGDGSLWDPVTGGIQMYGWTANHSGESVIATTDYPLGDPALKTSGSNPNYQASNASWSILVIYTSPETKGHQLYFYDTLRNSGRYETRPFEIEGFLAPASVLTEDDAAKMTCFVGEGDNTILGDNLYLNGHRLNNDAANTALAANNVWNGISNASSSNADGLDLDTFYISGSSGIIQPSDTEATLTFETQMDVWSMVYVILSLRSDLSGTGLLSYIVK
jgi:photosystem II stability/assembly factor-like uncharacterized protein